MPKVPAFQLSLTLGNDIGGGDKPCHAHVAAKEIILDNVNFYIDHGVLAVELIHQLSDKGACHGAGDHIDLLGSVDAVGPVQLARNSSSNRRIIPTPFSSWSKSS